MGTLLQVLGGLWFLLGVLNVMDTADSEASGFAFMASVYMFFFPGLVVSGIGAIINKKPSEAPPKEKPSAPISIETRLRALEHLRDADHISFEEFQERRARILDEI